MKKKKKAFKIVSASFVLIMMLSAASSVSVIANEETFEDGVWTYKGTGYTTTEWTNNTELVAKIDTYYYQNLRDIEFAGEDVYFYKRDAAGNKLTAKVWGYAYTEFKNGEKSFAKTEPKFDYTNVEVLPTQGCSIWNNATPHYYGNAIKDN